MAATRKVRVPQADGEITFSGGTPDDSRTFQVDNHLVSPRNKDEQADLLRLVDGARLATPKESGDTPDPAAAGGTPPDGK
jgi:hypothetical protein